MAIINIQKYFLTLYQATRHLFVPAEKKIPKIRIETRQYDKLKDQRVIVSIDTWPRTSRYPLVCINYILFMYKQIQIQFDADSTMFSYGKTLINQG